MAGVNKVMLIGRLGQDPELRALPSGDSVVSMSMATSETWKDKQTGEKKEATEWHKVVLFGRAAEVANEYLRKGSQCFIEGSLRTRKWTDRDGVAHYTTEIKGDRLQLLDSKQDSGTSGQTSRHPPKPGRRAEPQPEPAPEFDDDIPW